MGLRIKSAREKYQALLVRHRQEKAAVIKECSDRCLFEIKKATTVEVARSNFKTPWAFPAKVEALKSWIQLSTTTQEIQEVLRACGDRFASRTGKVIERWEKISQEEVSRAVTEEEIADALWGAPHPNKFHWQRYEVPEEFPAAVKAVEKLLPLSADLEELRRRKSYWLVGDLIGRYEHLKKLYSEKEEEFRKKISEPAQ